MWHKSSLKYNVKRSKVNYQWSKIDGKSSVYIENTSPGEVVQLVSEGFKGEITPNFQYSQYLDWFWGLNKK